MRFLSFAGDLIILNVLFLVCSLPVITVGASASAMYTMTLRMRRDKVSGGTIKGFFRAFAQNFKTVTIPGGAVIKAVSITAAILYAVSLSWVFALQSRKGKMVNLSKFSICLHIKREV